MKLAMKMLMISSITHPEIKIPTHPPLKKGGWGDFYSGYTLIEILIVIVIISIVASVATLTIHFNQSKQMETLAHQLVNQITLAEEEAMLRSVVLGVAMTAKTIQFYTYQEKEGTWQLEKHNYFRTRSIPDNTYITLKINGKPIPGDGKPHLIISSSGDIPAFVISIGKAEEQPLYQVIGEENGSVYAK